MTIGPVSAINYAISGMTSASQQLDAVAGVVSSGNGDLASAAVTEATASADFKANAAVMKTADKMMGSLLDITV
ncbi:MAG: flagellar hook protein FlgE [Caulobacteraceae bacterium]|nr:flagellar hook protein FlgE [Caulobacteraceae bacterium]